MQVLLPEGWSAPVGYANGIAVDPGRLVFIAGQVGWNAAQRFESEELPAQFEQALRNVLAVLRCAGGEPRHICRITAFCIDKPAYLAFVNAGRFAPDCFCWTELVDEPRSEVTAFVGGWVLAAFAEIGEPVSAADLDYVLQRQNSAGWWAMFPESGASQYQSTYTTAWLAFGLHKQRVAGLIPADRRAAVDRAISRATMWLMRVRMGARWRAHPNAPETDVPEALSGFVLHVLHQASALDLTDVDRAWLDSLPQKDLEPTSLDKHYNVLQYGHRSAIDHIVDIRLPWILLATADAYANGTAQQKARTLNWIEQILRSPEVRGADTEGTDWVRAEVLLGIAETSKLVECKDCQTAARTATKDR